LVNRFRKSLVRYEKLERSFVAFNHLVAAIIAFCKVPLAVNIIYGYVLKGISATPSEKSQSAREAGLP